MKRAKPTSATILRVLIGLCKPWVRFALQRSFKVQELIEIVKVACLEVAQENLLRQNLDSNVSRLSVLTGLQRKEIKRLESDSQAEVGNPNLLNRLIGKWQSDPEFCQKDRQPRALRYEGADSDFAKLVKTVSVDVNPYTVLFGLEQTGCVSREGKKLVLKSPVYESTQNTIDSMQIMAQDVQALYQAVDQNLFAPEKIPNLHITTQYDNICLDALPEIRDWLLEKGTIFHKEAREFLSERDKDLNPSLYNKKGGAKVSLSAFSFTENGKETSNE